MDEIRITQEVRAGDPFFARGAQLIAAVLFASEECLECGRDIDVMVGAGHDSGNGWLCEDCYWLPARNLVS